MPAALPRRLSGPDSGQPAAGDRGITLGRRSFAAALLAPRPASVPSIASPNTPGGSPGAMAGADGEPVGAVAVAPAAEPFVAAQPCGTDSAPARLARPLSAETVG